MLNFSHDGNFGDIIYSLPFCIKISKDNGFKKFCFHLRTNVVGQYSGTHPFGNVRLTSEAAEMIKPLLECQKYIDKVTISDEIPESYYDLSRFRNLNFIDLSCGSISQWYNPLSFSMTVPPDLSVPWIDINSNSDSDFNIGDKKIVLFRSSRYHRKNLNYNFLQQHEKKILFIGTEQEKKDFECEFFNVDFYQIKNFLEAAVIIKNAKLIVGNQTGLFSLAEAQKIPRLLETSYNCPNVVMAGGAFQYIMHTSQFIEVFKTFFNNFVN